MYNFNAIFAKKLDICKKFTDDNAPKNQYISFVKTTKREKHDAQKKDRKCLPDYF